jgi:hypothetical protein
MGKEMYRSVPRKVEDLLRDVENGRIGLPDLQRQFVWKDNKVRDLLDSMIKGFPIGYLILWSSPEDYENTKTIGKNDKAYSRPDDLVIDGQQRLTSLLAAILGLKVKDVNFKERNIRICFNPLTRAFEVWSQAYGKDPLWISDISEVFAANREHTLAKYRRAYIANLNASREKKGSEPLTDDEEIEVEENLNSLLNLMDYTIPTLQITTIASEEEVSDIFKRVNSGGQKLNENNFIETLLAVYDTDIYDKIHQFCIDSRIPKDGTPYNHIIEVNPQNLIRMAVGFGFKRARLKYAYMLLRGRNLDTGETTAEERESNMTKFKDALEVVTNLNNWHAFLNLFSEAGYYNSNMVSSTYVVIYGYVLYLLGKYNCKVPSVDLNKLITKWLFMSSITAYYSSSPESTVEKQFADLRDETTAEGFTAYINNALSTKFTDDYFNVTLPSSLNSSSANSPAWFGYIASVNVLGTPMWLSNTLLSKHLVVGSSGTKASVDKHHIFPKNYLATIGVADDRDRNQIANFTYLDYVTNIDIADNPPADYVDRYKAKLGEENFAISCENNAIPEGFESMSYFEFLAERRVLMSGIVKKAYQHLAE